MDLNLKVDLDELGRHFDDHDTKWELRFADLVHEHATREVAIDECLGSLETVCVDLASLCVEHSNAKSNECVDALEGCRHRSRYLAARGRGDHR